MRNNLHRTLVAFTAGVALLGGCLGGAPTGGKQTGGGDVTTPGGTTPGSTSPGGSTTTVVDPNQANLNARVIDYGNAARTAAVKLVGDLPTADELASVTDATSYAALIDKYLADPRFASQMVLFFEDQFKVGGAAATGQPSNMTAPSFAASLVTAGTDFRQVFTAATNTCPTLDAPSGVFTPASCTASNGLTTAGVLTDPGVQASMFSNMSMRRVRWLQESFECTPFPAEFSSTGGTPMGGGTYVSPWPFSSVAGAPDSAGSPAVPSTVLVNFQDTSGVICANCHTTINHIAPLFAQFDSKGVYQTSIQVVVPVGNTPPIAKVTDWLQPGETYAYRFGKSVTTIADLGTAMAADPITAECEVDRVWNWAMDKGDIVNDGATVPTSTVQTILGDYKGTLTYNLKGAIKEVFTADDYVKF
jgi:hypothetical protein